MTAQDVFQKLASMNCSVGQAVELTDRLLGKKTAAFGLDTAASVVHPLLNLAILAPPAAGYVAGDLLARGLDANSDTVEDLQQQELINQLRTSADGIRRQRELRRSKDEGRVLDK